MLTNRFFKVAILLLGGLALGILAFAIGSHPGAAQADSPSAQGGSVLEVEVAENGNRFSPDETPVFEDDGLPAYGAEFITEGYLYPAGTLTCDEEGCNGVLPDGTPEFLDQVIGTWVCRGWHIGDGAHTETGPWVVSTQTFSFGNVPGAKTLISDGFELSDMNVAFNRAVTGGSGDYLNVRGEQNQTFLGWNDSVGVSLKVSFRLLGGQ